MYRVYTNINFLSTYAVFVNDKRIIDNTQNHFVQFIVLYAFKIVPTDFFFFFLS